MTADSRARGRDSLEAVSFVYEKFDSRHYELFMRTWGGFIAKGDAKQISEEQLRLLYDANPAGASLLAIIEENGVWIGAISAIATEVILPDGSIVRAYQIGDFMVDPAQQGRGLGGKLLRGLTRFLVERGDRVYTFPNIRSIGVFLKQGYLELRSIPLTVYPLWTAMAVQTLRAGRRTRIREISAPEARGIADRLMAAPRSRGAIAKNGAYLAWRYEKMRDPADYRFLAVEQPKRGSTTIVVWSPFRYRGIRAQVVVDLIGDPQVPPTLCEAARSGARADACLGVHNVERRPGWSLPPLSIRVPRKYDPRPARLLVPPEDRASAELFALCDFTTGDWMGF